MDNKSRTPFGNNGNSNQLNKPLNHSVVPAPLDDFDAGKDLDDGPIHPGPLMQQHAPMKPAKRSKKGLWVTIITLLILGLAGAAGYFFWQMMDVRTQLSAKDAANQSLQGTVAYLKPLADAAQKDAAEPEELTADEQKAADKTAITEVVTAKLHAPTKDKDVKLTVNVMKQNDQFAYVNAGPETGGAAAYILKKVTDEWTIIYSGQEKVSTEVIETYTIPAEFQSGQ